MFFKWLTSHDPDANWLPPAHAASAFTAPAWPSSVRSQMRGATGSGELRRSSWRPADRHSRVCAARVHGHCNNMCP